ncbi:MAG: chromosome partitioning protein [Solirubrobacteraceae bacterium]|jgi:cellulose biosynthesis protein BcsQ|nr:chromosome partitioning protein [Solirubrobacteraceae bacterium]
MARVVALYNIKGGVGKTSAAVNLAWTAAEEGARVLLWDLDPQGAATYLLRVRPKVRGGGAKLVRGKTDPAALLKGSDHTRLDLLPADFSYRNMDLALDATKRPTEGLARVLAPLIGDYDYVFLDCAPAISLASEGVFAAADALLVPLVPTPLSLRSYDQLRGFVADHVAKPRPRIFAFFSMIDGRKTLHRDVAAQLAGDGGVLAAAIPAATDVERMGSQRRALAQFAAHGRAALAYGALWTELRGRLAR